MKRILLASAVCLGIGLSIPAHAQIPVTDTASITARATEALNALHQMQSDYNMMTQQYQQLQATYNTLSHPNQVLSLAQGMMQQQMQSPGSSAGSFPNLSFGNQLSAGASRFLSQNRFASPQGTDFNALEMARREQVTANFQAEAQAGMDRSSERIGYLNELQQSIQDQPDVTAVAAVEARISSEHLFLQNEANNVARLQLLQQASLRVDQQRAEQAGRKDADDWHTGAAARAFGDSGGAWGNSGGTINQAMDPADRQAHDAALQLFLSGDANVFTR